jgi:hypothetical protein
VASPHPHIYSRITFQFTFSDSFIPVVGGKRPSRREGIKDIGILENATK